MKRPAVFIGSSTEALWVAEAVQANLDRTCRTRLWSQSVFQLGQAALESLIQAANEADFAVLLLTADDIVTSRGKRSASPRDNLIFELGLFIGKLGPARTFVLTDRTTNTKLPTDFAGINFATYTVDDPEDLQGALGPACSRIAAAIRKQEKMRPSSERVGLTAVSVDVFFHPDVFRHAEALAFIEAIQGREFEPRLLEHGGPGIPDAAYIGCLVTAAEARALLSRVPYPIRYLFRCDLPDSEGGDRNGRKVGIGMVSDYNAATRPPSAHPRSVSPADMRRLLDPTLSNAAFHVLLDSLTREPLSD